MAESWFYGGVRLRLNPYYISLCKLGYFEWAKPILKILLDL